MANYDSIEDFMHKTYFQDEDANVNYAAAWFLHYSWSTLNEFKYGAVAKNREVLMDALSKAHNLGLLFADYLSEQWVINGYSSMGDVWLTKALDGSQASYDWRTVMVDGKIEDKPMRVRISDLSNWSRRIDKAKFYPSDKRND